MILSPAHDVSRINASGETDQYRTLISLKPAFSKRCLEFRTAWKGVGDALIYSRKLSAAAV